MDAPLRRAFSLVARTVVSIAGNFFTEVCYVCEAFPSGSSCSQHSSVPLPLPIRQQAARQPCRANRGWQQRMQVRMAHGHSGCCVSAMQALDLHATLPCTRRRTTQQQRLTAPLGLHAGGGQPEHDDRPTVLVTTVDIGGGRSDRIEIRKGDDPADAARKFCEQHQLPNAVLEPLTQHLLDNLRKTTPSTPIKQTANEIPAQVGQ